MDINEEEFELNDKSNPIDLVKAFSAILSAFETDDGERIFTTMLGDEILMVEIGTKRFRVMIQDTAKFS
jgi:hypothetical protein